MAESSFGSMLAVVLNLANVFRVLTEVGSSLTDVGKLPTGDGFTVPAWDRTKSVSGTPGLLTMSRMGRLSAAGPGLVFTMSTAGWLMLTPGVWMESAGWEMTVAGRDTTEAGAWIDTTGGSGAAFSTEGLEPSGGLLASVRVTNESSSLG